MVEEFAERRLGVGATRLFAIDGVQALVDEEAEGAQGARPSRGFGPRIGTVTAGGSGGEKKLN